MIEILVTAAVLCNNLNFHAYPCNASVASFTVDEHGEVWGVLESKIPFSQTNVTNEITRLQRFQLQNAFWYVSDKGAIWADNDLQALSIYLST